MKVAVFGLGYVGCVSAACFAHRGHDVIGVDTNPAKVDAIASGRTPVLEPGLQELVERLHAEGRLHATADAAQAVAASDVSIICVGTPSAPNGSLSLDAIERVVDGDRRGTACRGTSHTVVVRSTVLPGTTDDVVVPLLEKASGLAASADFGVAMNPEFLREGTALSGLRRPAEDGDRRAPTGRAATRWRGCTRGSARRSSACRCASPRAAKYVDNAFHALKIAFANEIGAFCKRVRASTRTR